MEGMSAGIASKSPKEQTALQYQIERARGICNDLRGLRARLSAVNERIAPVPQEVGSDAKEDREPGGEMGALQAVIDSIDSTASGIAKEIDRLETLV